MHSDEGNDFVERPLSRRQVLKGGMGIALGSSALGVIGRVAEASAATPKPKAKPKPDGDVNWLTWAQYIPPAVVTSFEKEYKVKVTQSFMTDDEQYVQKLAAGEPFDLITTNSAYLPQSYAGNLLQTFDPGDLKNWSQIIPFYQHPFYDNGQYRYTVPYGYGPTGIMYRSDKVTHISHTWNDLWNNPEAAGHTYILDQIEETLGASLLRLGDSLNSGDPGQVNKAANNLISLKPRLGGITTNIQALVGSGQAWLMHAWGTNTFQGMQQSKHPENIKFFLPKDGAPVACDTLSIGKNAKSPGSALLLIDWILRADNNHALGAYAGQRTGAKGGNAAFNDQMKKLPMFLFDDNAVLSNKKNWKIAPTGARLSLYNQAWARVKA